MPATLDVPLRLDPAGGSQAERVHTALRAAILGGQLAPGLRLPSSRALADQLAVGRNAVVVAYEYLHGDGLVEARQGAGTYVAALLPARVSATAPAAPAGEGAPSRRACALGCVDAEPDLLRRLGAAARRRIALADAGALGYGDPAGDAGLRQEIAAHLAASRGVVCDPSCIVITAGVQQGLRLCAEALLHPGGAVWFEDPGYPASRRTLAAAGMTLVGVPVDGEGLDVAAGRARADGAAAAYVTPSNQFPTGRTMSMARRLALLDWARAAGAWVLEDDYDNEFRYEGPPLTALAGLDRSNRVIYFGTFSKTLFPALRLAYLVLPSAAVAPVLRVRASHDRFPSGLLEAAVAALMADGTFSAHLRRMRKRYRAARDELAHALRPAGGGQLRVATPPQGLHLVAWLPPDAPPGAAVRIRALAGVEAWLVSETRIAAGGPDGFVLGFAGHPEAALRAAAAALCDAAARVLRFSATS